MSGTIQLPTTGTLTGVQLVEGINTALAEMTVDFRSATAPTAAGLGVSSLAGIKWRDSSATPEVLKVRNQADDAWITAGYYDEATDVFYPASALRASNNLSDLANADTALTNLGVYSTAQVDALVAAGTGTITATAGEAIDTSAAPKLVYKDIFNQRGSGAARWYLVDTDATSPVRISPVVGIATTSATSAGDAFTCQVLQGQVSGFTGLTADAPVWASGAAGALTQTDPPVPSSGTQNAVRMVGYAVSATTVMFEPWHDIVFQARNSALASAASITVEHWPDSGGKDRIASAYLAVSPGSDETSTPSTTSSQSMPYTQVDRSWAVDNNASVSALGLYLTGGVSKTVKLKIVERTSAGAYTVVADTGAVTHSGSGWQWFNLPSAYSVPSSGNFYVAAYYSTAGTYTVPVTGTVTRSYTGSDPSGSLSMTEDSGVSFAYPTGARYQTTSRDEQLIVGSETINSSGIACMTTKYADSADANQSTCTTFYNRTGDTRDVIVEVSL